MVRKGKLNQFDVVVVEWRDAYFDFDSKDKETRDDYIVSTVGFYLGENPLFITLAQEILPDGDGFRAVTHIPWEIIQTINGNKPQSR